jgi:hypothetical protein
MIAFLRRKRNSLIESLPGGQQGVRTNKFMNYTLGEIGAE